MVEQGKDGARNPAGFPALCAAALFFGFFFSFSLLWWPRFFLEEK
jgi:hypothetical protein